MPKNISSQFDSLFSLVEAPKSNEFIFVYHKVRRGENLTLIAKKYKARIKDIVEINKLSDKSYIRPNQKLKIPTKGYDEYKKSIQATSRKIYYTVKRGDTLSEIAERHKTSVRKVKKWNGLRSDKIYMGQKLQIWVKN